MDLKTIIDTLADEADELLADVSSKSEARPIILTYLSDNYPDLSPGDAARVSSGLIALLENEGFFDSRGRDNLWSEGEEDALDG